jgi:hypothetical protein
MAQAFGVRLLFCAKFSGASCVRLGIALSWKNVAKPHADDSGGAVLINPQYSMLQHSLIMPSTCLHQNSGRCSAFSIEQRRQEVANLNLLRPAKGAKVGGFRPAAAGAKASQGPFTCGTGELRSSRRVVSRRVRCALFLSLPPYARDQIISQGFDRLAACSVPLVAAAPRMNMHLACHGPFAAAEAASGLPPATYAPFSRFFNRATQTRSWES